jgi:hypothetical protein
MKLIKAKNWTAACAAVLAATAVLHALADQVAMTEKPDRPEKSYTGTVVSVDPQEHTLNAKGFVLSRKFNLGAACTYILWDGKTGTISDLLPGEKVTVGYQDADGVLVADRVEQQPMRYEGMVQAIDPAGRTLTLHFRGLDKTFQIANDCNVLLRDDKSGRLADIQAGCHVTVTYETPNSTLMARRIAQTSLEFTGTLTAIDLGEKTLKARATFGSKRFNVADNCAIVINGRTDGQLSDLKPNDKLTFSYDEINGVNVVNRIGPAETRRSSVASTSPAPMSGF